MKKLTDRQIIELHRLSRSGWDNGRLAQRMGVHRNTITSHLMFRVSYSSAIRAAVGIEAPLPKTNLFSIYAAAAYLPGWPSKSTVHRLQKSGVLNARLIEGRLMCCREDVRTAARKMLPRGLWVRSDYLAAYSGGSELVVNAVREHRRDSKYWPVSRWWYVPAPLAFGAAERLGVPLSVPLATRARAVRCLSLFDVASI